jgi:ABC-type cobalamin/Fe3+-siderophores transport system ATPase subunit
MRAWMICAGLVCLSVFAKSQDILLLYVDDPQEIYNKQNIKRIQEFVNKLGKNRNQVVVDVAHDNTKSNAYARSKCINLRTRILRYLSDKNVKFVEQQCKMISKDTSKHPDGARFTVAIYCAGRFPVAE